VDIVQLASLEVDQRFILPFEGHLSVKIRPIGAGYWTHCAAMALAARGVDGVIE
jgi:hypothetical protein